MVLVAVGRHLHEARDVPEASQGTVRAQHVGSDDDAAGEFDTQYRRPGHHGVPAGDTDKGQHHRWTEDKQEVPQDMTESVHTDG